MRLKKVYSIMLAALFTINCFSTTVSAHDLETDIDEEIIEEYQIADWLNSFLGISGTTAKYSSSASIGGNSITVVHTLQKHWGLWIWNDVANSTFTKTVNGNTIEFNSTKKGLDSGTYRVKSTFTMTNSAGQTETVTIYSLEDTVS